MMPRFSAPAGPPSPEKAGAAANWTEARPANGARPTPRKSMETPGAEVVWTGALLPQAAPRKKRIVCAKVRFCCLRLIWLKPLRNVVSAKFSTVGKPEEVEPIRSRLPPRKEMLRKVPLVLMRPWLKFTTLLSRRRVEPTSRKTRERQEPLASTSTVPSRTSRPFWLFWSMTSVTFEDEMRKVPAPSFSTELKRVEPPKLISNSASSMLPLAARTRLLFATVFWIPPRMRRVEPKSAPMTALFGKVRRPVTVLMPVTLWSWPEVLTPP